MRPQLTRPCGVPGRKHLVQAAGESGLRPSDDSGQPLDKALSPGAADGEVVTVGNGRFVAKSIKTAESLVG